MTSILCPICSLQLRVLLSRSRKAKNPKLFISLICPTDGRHFRGFIADQSYVRQVFSLVQDSAEGSGVPGELS